VSGAKSDATDAMLFANIIRTDADAHRPLPADTGLPNPCNAKPSRRRIAGANRHINSHQKSLCRCVTEPE
jgi:hypothetical protein